MLREPRSSFFLAFFGLKAMVVPSIFATVAESAARHEFDTVYVHDCLLAFRTAGSHESLRNERGSERACREESGLITQQHEVHFQPDFARRTVFDLLRKMFKTSSQDRHASRGLPQGIRFEQSAVESETIDCRATNLNLIPRFL
jgi:hypothetical protein